MSANINPQVLKNFIVKTIGGDKISKDNIQKYDISQDNYEKANTKDDNSLDLQEILDNKDLYEQFATLYVEEQDKKQADVDDEKAKEEQAKVKDKNEAGV